MFLLQDKSSKDLAHESSYEEADSRIWDKFWHIFWSISGEVLSKACTIGMKVGIYKLHIMSWVVFPFKPTIPDNPEIIIEMVPIECWNHALLSMAGQDRLFKIVQHIKEMFIKIC